jgi:LemA protein
VTKARNVAAAASSAGAGERAKLEGDLSGALARLLVTVERYPDLKANQNFLALQEELTSTENKISFSRQYYNDSVLKYNNQIQMFPSNVVANMGGFKQGEFFEVKEEAERAVPKVNLTSFTPPNQ